MAEPTYVMCLDYAAEDDLKSAAFVLEGEIPSEEVIAVVWQDICLDIHVTVGGYTMPATMWENPELWADDWADELGIDHGDVPEAVARILVEAIVEEP